MSQQSLAQLELELRQIGGVVLVSFSERDGSTTVELTIDRSASSDSVREQTLRLADAHMAGPVAVHVVQDGSPTLDAGPRLRLRVQLLAVVPLPGDRVEVHLSYRGRRAVSSCRAGDRVAVAEAVLDGLGKLGLGVPYEATAVHLLSGELGDGALVQLRHEGLSGTRRGLAGGRREEEAIARAVLNGLNRYLDAGASDGAGIGDTTVPGTGSLFGGSRREGAV